MPRLAPLLLLLAACGRNIEDGKYLATVTVVGIDTCEDAEELAAEEVFEINLEVQGDTVWITSTSPQLHGAGGGQDPATTTHPRPPLVGRFLYGAQREVFIADTNFEVVKTINNPDLGPVSCDSLAHIAVTRGEIDDPRHFHGQLRKTYEPRAEAAPACVRGCAVELDFDAVFAG
jgi:hypothetical protein